MIVMKQYVVDELRPGVREKIEAYLENNFGPAKLNEIYWIPLEENALSDVQATHSECQPHCFAIVLEAVPTAVATAISQRLTIPTIGIGAGAGCDGQVLVYHDMLGLFDKFVPKFVKQYVNLAPQIRDALIQFKNDVDTGTFPGPEHSFAMKEEEAKKRRWMCACNEMKKWKYCH